MTWRDPQFRYHTVAETTTPGYLKRRFDQVRRELKAAADARAEAAAKVKNIHSHKGNSNA